jgi:hypothetical protein
MIMRDYALPREKITPPSRLGIWLEERVLQHNIAVLRKDLDSVLAGLYALDSTVPQKMDDLFKLLDLQAKRGFRHQEKLHWPLVLINWQIFGGLMICVIGIMCLWGALR